MEAILLIGYVSIAACVMVYRALTLRREESRIRVIVFESIMVGVCWPLFLGALALLYIGYLYGKKW